MEPEPLRLAPDLVALPVLVVAFASWVTLHVALSYRLIRQGPAWRGLLALIVPPLAPFWGFASGLRWLPRLWLALFGIYLAALGFASF